VATTFFDTHDYVKRLEESGIPTAHAKALAEAMNNELVKKLI
jgi:crotonobetainyl-CoA:carnitine CoA-transferase CaiB-like acyl-CoA transferase